MLIGSGPRPASAWAAWISATMARASAGSCGVTKPTSAAWPISRYAAPACPSAATTGCPCGGRGVIDGPLTLK